MNTQRLFSLLDEILPNEKIIKDLSNRIWDDKQSEGNYIELYRDYLFVPKNVPIDIVTKSLYKEY